MVVAFQLLMLCGHFQEIAKLKTEIARCKRTISRLEEENGADSAKCMKKTSATVVRPLAPKN